MPAALPETVKATAEALAASGMSTRKIAKDLGVNRATVWKWQQQNRLSNPKHASVITSLSEKFELLTHGITDSIDDQTIDKSPLHLRIASIERLVKANQLLKASSGYKETITDILEEYKIETSASVSRKVTRKQIKTTRCRAEGQIAETEPSVKDITP